MDYPAIALLLSGTMARATGFLSLFLDDEELLKNNILKTNQDFQVVCTIVATRDKDGRTVL